MLHSRLYGHKWYWKDSPKDALTHFTSPASEKSNTAPCAKNLYSTIKPNNLGTIAKTPVLHTKTATEQNKDSADSVTTQT